MKTLLAFTIAVITVAGTGLVMAEKVDTPGKGLREEATHIVTGEVAAIYQRRETVGDWRYTRYCAEVRISKVEKDAGKDLAKDGLVYVRYWRRSWVGDGPMPPSTSGHRGLPKAGENLRIYLARNAYDGFTFDNKDGGYNVLGANGFEKLP